MPQAMVCIGWVCTLALGTVYCNMCCASMEEAGLMAGPDAEPE